MLPPMKTNVRLRRRLQSTFAGLDHNDSVRDGYLYDMKNLSGNGYPAVSVRRGRSKLATIPSFHGMGAAEGKLFWASETSFFYDGKVVGTVKDSDKVFGRLGNRIVIWPDKKMYNISTGAFESLELSVKQTVQFTSYAWDTTSEEAAEVYQGNAIRTDGVPFPFGEGDAVFVEGSEFEKNNRSAVIRRVMEDGKLLVFTNNLFTETAEKETVTISRRVPDADHACQLDNRLWASKGDDVYACSLGIPSSWYDYDVNAGSSYAVPVGTDGDFTGAGTIGGYAVFFKPDAIHKLYGDKPSNFQMIASAVSGCIDGRSIEIAGETMFFLSRNGIMSYRGGSPSPVSSFLGQKAFTHGVAGSDGRRYYISLYDGDQWVLYVLDTQTGMWFKEDDVQAKGFAYANGSLYMVDGNDVLWSIDTASSDGVEWFAETGDMIENDPNKTGLCKIYVRMELDPGATATVKTQFDDSGVWQVCRSVPGNGRKQMLTIPIVPRRCDHFRIRIDGVGGCRIYELSREYYPGSDV